MSQPDEKVPAFGPNSEKRDLELNTTLSVSLWPDVDVRPPKPAFQHLALRNKLVSKETTIERRKYHEDGYVGDGEDCSEDGSEDGSEDENMSIRAGSPQSLNRYEFYDMMTVWPRAT